MWLLFFTAVASSSAATIPSPFLGRWESKASECKTSIDNRLDQSFVVVEPKKLWTFEAEDEVKWIRIVSPRDLIADVVSDSEGLETSDKAKLTLITPNHLSVRLGKGWPLAIYVRCPKLK